MSKKTVEENLRVTEVYNLFVKHLEGFLKEANLNHEEYTKFIIWADRLGKEGELPLFTDVFFESQVLKAMYSHLPGTQPSLLGPYYLEGSPLIEHKPGEPIELTQRPDEPGDLFYFKGNVSNVDGEKLANAKVDFWQNDDTHLYSGFDSDAPKYNLRGHFYTDENGDFEVKTIVPAAYSIPDEGPTGEFLDYTGQHPMRPAHLHIMFEAEGHDTLITQVFFEGDKWLETDVADGVREDLLTKLVDKGTHFESSLDFVLRKL